MSAKPETGSRGREVIAASVRIHQPPQPVGERAHPEEPKTRRPPPRRRSCPRLSKHRDDLLIRDLFEVPVPLPDREESGGRFDEHHVVRLGP